jgi:superfamily II DNA or RNA helicase
MASCSQRDAETALVNVRAVIARELLDGAEAPLSLGDITLHSHQRHAAARLARLLRAHGGALLADPTGLGKTFVALAVARDVQHLLIICPAALRAVWTRALEQAGAVAVVISVERLSRGIPSIAHHPELIVIDESHHLRNPATKRYAAVASLCDRTDVLLLSATPVQNRRADLVAQLALFLGDAAYAMTDMELAHFVVRREMEESAALLPAIDSPQWIHLGVEDDILEDLLSLPPAAPLADGGDAHSLLRYTLLRQWSSSRAALVGGLRSRLARGVALISALDAGRRPTRHALAAWSHSDDSVQLALPELLVASGVDGAELQALRLAAEAHVTAIRALLDRLRARPDPDPARADAVRGLRQRHPETRIIAFSQYAQTVRAISRLLITRDAGIAELTAGGGRVAGGRIRREDVLAQFAPTSPPAAAIERIGLLVTTDVSSEGLDLQRASVVVHLDLPWNPARLEQRVGRVRRLGGPHDRVFVYALAPPAPSERVLDVEARLRAKIRVAARLVGIGAASLPGSELEMRSALPGITSDLYRLLSSWRWPSSSAPLARHGPTECAAVNGGGTSGFLALLADGDERVLIGDEGAGPTVDPGVLQRLAALAGGPAATASPEERTRAGATIEGWWQRRRAREQIHLPSSEGMRVRARVAARISALLGEAPRHVRASLAAPASAARHTLAIPLGIGAERRLAALGEAAAADERWLAAIGELGAGRAVRRTGGRLSVTALILFQGEDSSREP